ncbi:MAG: GNAT family N-acetyltransferase, partial [Phenylobacterium sp.]
MPLPRALPLRTAEPSDAAAIRALTRRAYQPWVARLGREPLPMGADYDLAVRDHRFDLLERDGRLVALIETELRPDSLYVVNVAVDPDLQGQRLGLALLAHAE